MALEKARTMAGLVKHALRHRRTERLDRAALEAAQLSKLRKLAAFVRERSPYYARVMRERGIEPATCRPEDFPVLTKDLVSAHFDEIVTDPRITRAAVEQFSIASKDPSERFLGEYFVVHTSGSSGEMGYFLYDLDAWVCGISHLSRAAGIRLRQKLAFVGTTGGHYAGLSMISFARRLPLLYADVLTLSCNAPTEGVVAELNRYQPTTLTGYPTVLATLARRQLAGELAIRPTLIQTSGEAFTVDIADLLRRAFAAPVMNVYSCTEFLFLGVGRDDWGAMVLLEDDLIFEPHHDHVCITGLFNRTLPLIRYRVNDVLTPARSRSDRLPFRAVEHVVGRHEHAPVFVNRHGREDQIHPLVFTEFPVANLARYQLRLRDRRRFDFLAQLAPDVGAAGRAAALGAIRRRLDEILAEKEMDNVAFDIRVVDEIRVDPDSGKFRLVVGPGGNWAPASLRAPAREEARRC